MPTISQLKPKPLKRKCPQGTKRLMLLFDFKAARLERRLGLREVAAASGVSKATLSRVELGAEPDLVTAFKMVAFYEKEIVQCWSLPMKGRKP